MKNIENIKEKIRLKKVEKITSSFGIASYHKGEKVKNLLHRADLALYNAKQNGRNCVEIAPAPENI